MSQFQLHKEFYNKPILLSNDEIKDPVRVIACFFENFRLYELREILEEIREDMLGSEIDRFKDPDARAAFLHFFREIEGLLEASFLLAAKVRIADGDFTPEQRWSDGNRTSPASDISSTLEGLVGPVNLTELLNKVTTIQSKFTEVVLAVATAHRTAFNKAYRK